MTTRKLHISPDLALPHDAVTSTFVVYGGKGMGKTNLATVFCEELSAARLRFAAIDPMGVMWGLRHARDGKGEGIKVLILGGRHGDIPIEPTGGAIVADLVADEDVDVVIDISRRPDGTMWGVGERIRFVRDYCSRLYQRQGERRRPLMQIIDEAGRYCPQLIPHGSPELSDCVGAIERLVEEGRNVGVGVALITQRSARMNKSVSELADCMIAFRTVGPRSVDAILDWFGEHVEKSRWKELVERLRALPRGTALVVSPGWLGFEGTAAIRERSTFDSSSTPSGGREVRASGAGAKPDLDRYVARMQETIERAKAENPKELRRLIEEQRRKIAKLERDVATKPPQVEKVPVVGLDELHAMERLVDKLLQAGQEPMLAAKTLADRLDAVRRSAGLGAAALGRQAVSSPPAESQRNERVLPKSTGTAPRSTATGEQKIGKAERAILTVLAQRHPKPTTIVQAAILTGYAHDGGGFTNAVSAARAAGRLVGSRDALTITDVGLEAVPDAAPLPSGDELVAWWMRKLGKAERAALEVLFERYPRALTKEQLAEATGYAADGGGFNNALSRLRTLELITRGAEMRASETFFDGGAR